MLKVNINLVGMLLFCAVALNVYGVTVNTNGTTKQISFSKTAESYSLSASAPSGWTFTKTFNHPSSNGWYVPASTSYTVRYERLEEGTTAFVDATSTFSATISGAMYKPGGTGGSLVAWSVRGSGSGSVSYSISPSSANIAYGDNENFVYKLDGNNAPGGMWKYSPNGGDYSGDSSSYTFPPSGSLAAGSYTVSAARNSAGARGVSAPARYVKVDKVQASVGGGAYADATTLFVIIDASLSLKAIPDPPGAWPDSNPDWSCSGTWIIASHFLGASDDVDVVSMDTSEGGDVFTVTAECGTSTKSVTVTVVQVESITGLEDVYCNHASCSQAVTATLTAGAGLPAGASITWAGDADFESISGLTATAKFANHVGKDKNITAKLSTQTPVESSDYDVVSLTTATSVSSVTYNYVYQAPTGTGNAGVTEPSLTVTNITAYFTHLTHTWKSKVTSATSQIGQGSRMLSGVNEATVAACTSQAIYRQMHSDLTTRAGSLWFMIAAIDAHEKVHSDSWETLNNPLFNTFKTAVESLSVEYDSSSCDTPAKAKTEILDLTSYENALDSFDDNCVTQWNASIVTDHAGPTTSAEFSVLYPRRTALIAHAAAQNPAWTL